MKENKSFIEYLKEINIINVIKLIPLACVILSIFMLFLGVMVIVFEITNIDYPTISGQITWTIIWAIASFKIAFSLEEAQLKN